MNTKGKVLYEVPSLEVSYIVLEGCIAASVQMVPEESSFNKYDWDVQPETASDEIQFLY